MMYIWSSRGRKCEAQKLIQRPGKIAALADKVRFWNVFQTCIQCAFGLVCISSYVGRPAHRCYHHDLPRLRNSTIIRNWILARTRWQKKQEITAPKLFSRFECLEKQRQWPKAEQCKWQCDVYTRVLTAVLFQEITNTALTYTERVGLISRV